MDNLSSHKTLRLAEFMAANNIEAVFTPTYASWLKPSSLTLPMSRSLPASSPMTGTT
jgi:transposase